MLGSDDETRLLQNLQSFGGGLEINRKMKLVAKPLWKGERWGNGERRVGGRMIRREDEKGEQEGKEGEKGGKGGKKGM